MFSETIAQYSTAEFAGDVRAGLTNPGQKELPPKYFYDEVGSALFEAITLLAEYGLSRADERLLREHAEAMVRPLLPGPVAVAELGSGNGKKTRWILQSLAQWQRTTYYPIEISPAALAQCVKELGQLDRVNVNGIERAYLEGLESVAANRHAGERLLVLFLGSTIGNFDRPAAQQFLADVRRTLQPGDALLLGVDLVKPVEQLLSAYDDSLGVTASFNLNLLARINRELGADFDLRMFEHSARYDDIERRIEMHLVSRCRQEVSIPGAGCAVAFGAGETIWTESSYKYTIEEITQIGESFGFHVKTQWVDRAWPFAENLMIAE
ncbi:MAG: L-histidine N(alpha)-methyltransferase [Candidatus Acidiferrales bacterium]